MAAMAMRAGEGGQGAGQQRGSEQTGKNSFHDEHLRIETTPVPAFC
jgi:hypothetical protein